jgi:hypothetical protein
VQTNQLLCCVPCNPSSPVQPSASTVDPSATSELTEAASNTGFIAPSTGTGFIDPSTVTGGIFPKGSDPNYDYPEGVAMDIPSGVAPSGAVPHLSGSDMVRMTAAPLLITC